MCGDGVGGLVLGNRYGKPLLPSSQFVGDEEEENDLQGLARAFISSEAERPDSVCRPYRERISEEGCMSQESHLRGGKEVREEESLPTACKSHLQNERPGSLKLQTSQH